MAAGHVRLPFSLSCLPYPFSPFSRRAVVPVQGYCPQKGLAQCPVISQRQAATHRMEMVWARKEEQLEKVWEHMCPGPVPRGDLSTLICFITTLCLPRLYWLILTAQAHGKNLKPPLKVAVIIIRLHNHHSVFIMVGAFFQTPYICFGLEN